MTAPKTSPAMGLEQQGIGGEQDEGTRQRVEAADRPEELGLDGQAVVEGQQVLGTCSPELIDPAVAHLLIRLRRIRDTRLTFVEKDAVDQCIAAARELLGVSE